MLDLSPAVPEVLRELIQNAQTRGELELLACQMMSSREREGDWPRSLPYAAPLAELIVQHPLADDAILRAILTRTGYRGYPQVIIHLTPYAPHIWRWEETLGAVRSYLFTPGESRLDSTHRALARLLLESLEGEAFRAELEKLLRWFPEPAAEILAEMPPSRAHPVEPTDLADLLRAEEPRIRLWALRALKHLRPELVA